jgi:phenylpropionate dioxygenase-like ring-hydroxylating dioxygenase large terminal subunit
VEGGLDYAHGPFVHRGTFGRFMAPEVEDFEVQAGEWSGRASDDGLGGLAWFLPSSTLTDLDFGTSRQMILQAHLPVDADRTRTFWVSVRDYATTPLADGVVRLLDHLVLREDRRVVEALRPELLPFDLSDELHVRSDALQVAYRRRRRELIASGWPVVGDPVGQGPARVLPSPARRDTGLARAWVHRAGV